MNFETKDDIITKICQDPGSNYWLVISQEKLSYKPHEDWPNLNPVNKIGLFYYHDSQG